MKIFKVGLIPLLVLSGSLAQAQTSNGSNITSSTSIKKTVKKKARKKFEFTISAETASVRDQNFEVQGNSSLVILEPGYRVTNNVSVSAGAQYDMREAGGTRKGNERFNRDHLGNVFARVLYKGSRYRDNGIGDFRFQARVYSDQDDYFKRFYGGDGNYQLRAYFGRPIAGRWYINKYTTYVRYKNYFNNEYVGRFSRDYELRARLSPTYRVSKGFDLGMTFTYNHFFKVQKTNDEEVVNVDTSIRYQKGKYAALFIVSSEYMNNDGGAGTLQRNEEAGKDLTYILNLTAFL